MGRTYAGITGLLAFVTVMARGIVDGASAAATLQTACLCMFLYAAVGYVAGRVAEVIVRDSVTVRLHAELAARHQNTTTRENESA